MTSVVRPRMAASSAACSPSASVAPGTYTVTLTVTDNLGATGTDMASVLRNLDEGAQLGLAFRLGMASGSERERACCTFPAPPAPSSAPNGWR